jgi:hypothetical protein
MKCAFLGLNPNLPKFKAQSIIGINSNDNESKNFMHFIAVSITNWYFKSSKTTFCGIDSK